MKTDAELKRDVAEELAWDPAVNASAVGVAVKDGVVTLTGHLDTYAEKAAVERVLKRVGGVKAIALELDVRLAPGHVRSDTDIARAAEQALGWNSMVPANKVRVIVDRGWVTLQGQLEWDCQRQSAEKAVRALVGVVGLSNEIALTPRTAPSDVTRRIREALTRQAQREAKHLAVQVSGGTVTLQGQVHSWHERQAAQGAAWAAPGVTQVINELTIAD
ncbi:MAG TPA: BON domain-containing protein [Burkholderiaceae bacterium]|nr:BON domain-containing protein [Burkholderiaceae bacterium]